MKVELLAYTPNPEYVCYLGSRTCRSPVGTATKNNTWTQTPEMIRSHIWARLKDGHLSIFEHAVFTFGIEGISRTCSHQLVRHRIASYSQQSQRYTIGALGSAENVNDLYVIPESFIPKGIGGDIITRVLMNHLRNSKRMYDSLVENGVNKEDARFVLPQATKTNLVMTINARSLMNFFDLRLSEHAQWEIRKLAQMMLYEVKKAAPSIFQGYD